MPLDQLATATAAALGEDIVRELLAAAAGMATGQVREVTLQVGADRRPILAATRVTKGPKIPA